MKKGTRLIITKEHTDHPFKKGETVYLHEILYGADKEQREGLAWVVNDSKVMALVHETEYVIEEDEA